MESTSWRSSSLELTSTRFQHIYIVACLMELHSRGSAFPDVDLLNHLPVFQLCGMCGNYNHNSSDDNLMPNKKPAKDVIELGNSWKSEGDSDPGSVC